MNVNTAVSLTPSDEGTPEESGNVNVELEQDLPEEDNLRLRDVYDMWILAKNGKTARSLKPNECPVKFTETTVTITLAFIVWPYPETTPYSLSATIGDISEQTSLEREREESIVFPLAREVSFERLISNISYEWETPAYTDRGELRPNPTITVVRDMLTIPDPLFAVARVKFTETGHRYELEITLDNVDEEGNNIQITGLSPVITALWKDEEGNSQTTELTLELPQCVIDALKLCKAKPNMVCQGCNAYEYRVYFNACGDDDILEERLVELEKDGGHWCLPME